MIASRLLSDFLSQANLEGLTPAQDEAFDAYLALLMKWNSKLNLTAIRDPEIMVKRHFFESILCARLLPQDIETLLDFGSGGGFPGIPIAICRPEIQVSLGESQSKKASFLMEVVRTLGLTAKVEAKRAEDLPSRYQAVTLRAVDKMEQAVEHAKALVAPKGSMILMAGMQDFPKFHALTPEFRWKEPHLIPGTSESCIFLGKN